MSRRNKKEKGQKINPEEIINSAVQEGLNNIMEHHPGFRKFGRYLSKHVDRKRLGEKWGEVYETVQRDSGLNSKEKLKYLHKEILDYVASGRALDGTGQRIILRRGLEEETRKPGIRNYFARRSAKKNLEADKNIDVALGAWMEIYEALRQGGYDAPEIERPLKYLSRAGFASAAADILRESKLVSSGQYRNIKDKIRTGYSEAHKEATSGLERMSEYQVAASIFGIFGTILIAVSGTGITGNIIGNSTANISGIIAGAILCVLAFALWISFKKVRK